MTHRAVVVDTNVVVAGLITSDPASPTAQVLDRMLLGQIPFLVSTALLAEYRRVLLRPRIQDRHRLDVAEIDRILATLAANAIVREPEQPSGPSPSGKDQHLWDLLQSESDSILVTGDRLLLDNPPGPARVVTPAGLLDLQIR